MKIDLHLHSLASQKNGDTIQWTSDYQVLKTLHYANVKIFSFCDHNTFDIEQFFRLKNKIGTTNLLMLAGVEVNVVRQNHKVGHLLIIFETQDYDELLQISQIIRQNLTRRGISIDKINHLFQEFATIRIAHVGKSDYFNADDLEKLHCDAWEITSNSNSNFVKVQNKLPNKAAVVAFSDTHIWSDYPQQKKLYTEIDLKQLSFVSLKKALLKRINYTKEI